MRTSKETHQAFFWGKQGRPTETTLGITEINDTSELFNLALLARQAWRILKSLDSLCARMIKSIYFPVDTILTAEVGSNPSQIWRSIVKGRDVLSQGLIRRSSNGASAHIWALN